MTASYHNEVLTKGKLTANGKDMKNDSIGNVAGSASGSINNAAVEAAAATANDLVLYQSASTSQPQMLVNNSTAAFSMHQSSQTASNSTFVSSRQLTNSVGTTSKSGYPSTFKTKSSSVSSARSSSNASQYHHHPLPNVLLLGAGTQFDGRSSNLNVPAEQIILSQSLQLPDTDEPDNYSLERFQMCNNQPFAILPARLRE